MRLSDLLGAEVRDGRNRAMGVVRDVRATADEQEGGRWTELRIDALVVAPRWWPRVGVDRPFVFGWLDRRFRSRSRLVPWDRIESIDGRIMRVRVSG